MSNQVLFRELNERIADRADGSLDRSGAFIRECANTGCTARIEVPLNAYQRVRDEDSFLVAPGQQGGVYKDETETKGEAEMAVDRRRGGRFAGGIGVGGILVVIGIVVALLWSLILGIIIALVGLIAFGGFVSGKWY